MELELEKRNIHRSRWKNGAGTQITLDDDFIVPDSMDDAEQLILSSGEITLEPVKVQTGKAAVRGSLDFRVLFRGEEGGLQSLGGSIPFEETVNVPELEERDTVGIRRQLEDLKAELIHSRKLGIRALITLEILAEATEDTEAAVDLAAIPQTEAPDGGRFSEQEETPGEGETPPRIETKKEKLTVASVALRRRDTCRVREELALAGSKPAIGRLLWTELRLTGVSTRPLAGKVELSGTLTVFALYEGEGEQELVEWMESAIPVSCETEAAGASGEMIPAIGARLIHKEIEEKPDADGELRLLSVDAAVELDIRLYEEQELEFLSDLYATNRELTCETGEAVFDRILTRNRGTCRLAERVELGGAGRILQVCHGLGNVKVDEAAAGDGILAVSGVLEVQILYLTDSDAAPVQSETKQLPFRCEVGTPGITPESLWHLEVGLEQLTVAMAGGAAAEVRAVLAPEVLVLQPERRRVITGAQLLPPDMKKLRELPGIVGYRVQEGDTLWDVAKRFHTTSEDVMQINALSSETLTPGTCLILVKEAAR